MKGRFTRYKVNLLNFFIMAFKLFGDSSDLLR